MILRQEVADVILVVLVRVSPGQGGITRQVVVTVPLVVVELVFLIDVADCDSERLTEIIITAELEGLERIVLDLVKIDQIKTVENGLAIDSGVVPDDVDLQNFREWDFDVDAVGVGVELCLLIV